MEKITPKRLSWASILEQGTRDQAVTTASMPFIHPHLALMPDAHLDVIWTRCKHVADSERGTRRHTSMVSTAIT